MARVLVVTQPFADYATGAVISDADRMEAALASNPSHVVASDHYVPAELVIETVAEEASATEPEPEPAPIAPHKPARKRG